MSDNPYQSPVSELQEASVANDDGRMRLEPRYKLAVAVISLVIYAVLTGVLFDPKVQEVLGKAFGKKPFGLPVGFVAGIGQTILYLPAPYFFWHYLASIACSEHPDVWRSRWICRLGMAYGVTIMIAWILYTEWLGI